MSASDIIDTSGSTPSLRISALVAAASGTVIYGYYSAVVSTLDRIGSGAAAAYRDLADWIANDYIGSLIEIPIGAIDAATAANQEFLALFGAAAPAVAAVELMILVWIMLRVSTELIGYGRTALS